MAIAAMIPMIATTISNSISEKPLCFLVFMAFPTSELCHPKGIGFLFLFLRIRTRLRPLGSFYIFETDGGTIAQTGEPLKGLTRVSIIRSLCSFTLFDRCGWRDRQTRAWRWRSSPPAD